MDRQRYDPKALIVASLRSMVRALDPAAMSDADAVAAVDYFALVERLGAAGKAIAAGRVASGSAWGTEGDRSPADWLAKRTGSSVADARSALATAGTLGAAPASATDEAFRSGSLSTKQAEAVAPAAAADPAAEHRLLAMAQSHPLQKLRDEAARVRAAADPDPAARHDRIRRGRYWRRWTDGEGARCGTYRVTPEDGAMFEAMAQPFIDAAIDEARRTGQHEPGEAYAADGLMAMARAAGSDGCTPTEARGGRGRRRLGNRRELIALVNVESLQRGRVEPGEMCEIAGVGPVPVEVARELFGDALLRVVIRDGVDIRTVVHTGRVASALQETAVLVRDRGRCIRPGCGRPISEIDHTEAYADTWQTTLDQLGGLCAHDHDLKSRHGHTYRRLVDGTIEWRRPDGAIEVERPPP